MVFQRLVTRRPAGEFIEVQDGRVIREGQTLRCIHCGGHWEIRPGSGRRRGFCFHCNGPTCGQRGCDTCESHEARLARMEQRQALFRRMCEG